MVDTTQAASAVMQAPLPPTLEQIWPAAGWLDPRSKRSAVVRMAPLRVDAGTTG